MMVVLSRSTVWFAGVTVSVLFSLTSLATATGNPFQSSANENAYVRVIDSQAKFTNQILESDSVWMVLFFSDETDEATQKAVTRDYKGLAELSKGICNLAAVPVSTEGGRAIAASYSKVLKSRSPSSSSTAGISYPAILIFTDDRGKPKLYTGEMEPRAILQQMLEATVQTLNQRAEAYPNTYDRSNRGKNSEHGGSGGRTKGPRSHVVQLTSANFQEKVLDNPAVSLIAFAAPWCGHCKKLLPEWEEASKKLDGQGVMLGWVDATAETHLSSIYQIKGYPTIKIFPGGPNKSYSDAKDYNYGREAPDIVRAALAEVDRTGVPREIPELTSQEVVDDNCRGQNRICVLVALPHILDSGADGRKKYKDLISTVSKAFRGDSFSFLWFEGGSQSQLEQTLE
jgi:protein disulfide-isomerase A6